MEPSRPSRIRDLATALLIAIAVVLLFADVTLRADAFRYWRGWVQESPDTSADESDDVPAKQVEQYVAVYRAMQQNHSLTIDQACAQQGLTVPAFRTIEHKIERNDQIQTRVREELRAKTSKPTAPAAHP